MRVLKQSDSRLLSVIEHDLGFLKRRVRQAAGRTVGLCRCCRPILRGLRVFETKGEKRREMRDGEEDVNILDDGCFRKHVNN